MIALLPTELPTERAGDPRRRAGEEPERESIFPGFLKFRSEQLGSGLFFSGRTAIFVPIR